MSSTEMYRCAACGYHVPETEIASVYEGDGPYCSVVCKGCRAAVEHGGRRAPATLETLANAIAGGA